MKNLVTIIISILIPTLASCNYAQKSVYAIETDSEAIPHTEKYILDNTVKDTIPKIVAREFRQYQDLILKKEYDKVIDYFYPGLFKLIHMEIPDMNLDEIKETLKKALPKMYEKNYEKYIYGKLPSANRYNTYFNAIEKCIKNGDNILITYSRITYIYNDIDSIKNDELDYGLAISLDNGKKWYFLDANIEDSKSSLRYNFSDSEIEYILTQENP